MTSSRGLLPQRAGIWLAKFSLVWIPFVTFVKCQRRSVSSILCSPPHSILSIIGNHKNNLYYQCQSERRITSLPHNPEGPDYGMWGVELGAFWRLAQLIEAWSWIAAHPTLLHVFLFAPCHSALCMWNELRDRGKAWNTFFNSELSFPFLNETTEGRLNARYRIPLKRAQLPPGILLMIPRRKDAVIPLWNTLW